MMIVNWIELSYVNRPWENAPQEIAYAVAGDAPNSFRLIRLIEQDPSERLSRFLDDIQVVADQIAGENGGTIDLNKLRLAFPDRGTALKTSAIRHGQFTSVESAVFALSHGGLDKAVA